ncbi:MULTISPECIES: hypothetical protein [Sphingobium]|nr:hypothetical protein [Sphingobium sp. 15-1]
MTNANLSPFGLSLSKPSFFLKEDVKPFGGLRVNGHYSKDNIV